MTYSKSSFHHEHVGMSHINVAVILTKIWLKISNVYLNDLFLPGIEVISAWPRANSGKSTVAYYILGLLIWVQITWAACYIWNLLLWLTEYFLHLHPPYIFITKRRPVDKIRQGSKEAVYWPLYHCRQYLGTCLGRVSLDAHSSLYSVSSNTPSHITICVTTVGVVIPMFPLFKELFMANHTCTLIYYARAWPIF